MARNLTEALRFAINEAISMTLENADPCPQALVNEHFDVWQQRVRIEAETHCRGLHIAGLARELAQIAARHAEEDKNAEAA
jgi:hypothetical protein